ncbi:MAG: DegQ family serine endoprotease, partial [Verrucomicrobiota bacterium]
MKKKLSVLTVGALCASLFVATGGITEPKSEKKPERTGPNQISFDFSEVAEQAIPGVVFISVEKNVDVATSPRSNLNNPQGNFGDDFLRRFFSQPMPQQGQRAKPRQKRFMQTGQGSGFIIDKKGHILTNHHVIGDADKVKVRLHDGRDVVAEIVGTDPKSEVAVIKVDADDLPVLPLGDSEDLRIGEWVMAVGNPFGLSETLTVGVVSAKGRSNIGLADYENFIQTDAAINPGNSGGPLLNAQGEVIGINTAIYSRSGGYMGIGFAIPIDMASQITEQLIESGKVQRGQLGVLIQDLTMDLATSFDLDSTDGILVAQIGEDSPAEQAGVEMGDVILELNGQPVENVSTFRNDIAATRPGTDVELLILRDGSETSLNVEIGSMEKGHSLARSENDRLKQLGFSVEAITPQVAQRLGERSEAGVLIDAVEPGSVAAAAGLRPGQLIRSVNRREVRNLNDF